MTLTVAPNVNAASARRGPVSSSGAAANTRVLRHQSVPTFVPADQLYYWSYAWQDSERRAREDLRAGRFRRFADPTAAVRYLRGSDR